jgi:hypothetical protein
MWARNLHRRWRGPSRSWRSRPAKGVTSEEINPAAPVGLKTGLSTGEDGGFGGNRDQEQQMRPREEIDEQRRGLKQGLPSGRAERLATGSALLGARAEVGERPKPKTSEPDQRSPSAATQKREQELRRGILPRQSQPRPAPAAKTKRRTKTESQTLSEENTELKPSTSGTQARTSAQTKISILRSKLKLKSKEGTAQHTYDLKNEFFIENQQEYNRFAEVTALPSSFLIGINKIFFGSLLH